jgi:hypothetical protein
MGLVSTHELLNRWAALQRDDGRGLAVGCGFCFHPQLSVAIFLALVFQVCRNRFRCHGQSLAEPRGPLRYLIVLAASSAVTNPNSKHVEIVA